MSLVLQAPEIIFRDMVSPAPSTDIWALGVLLYMILNRKAVPFESDYNREKVLIRQMVLILGKLPDKWWDAWAERAEYFLENGVCRAINRMVPTVGIGIEDERDFSTEEVNAFQRLLYKIFCYLPEERIDAEEVVRLIPSGWKYLI
ncbi:hypothetical protein BDQ17DRAFT_1328487 [Cyathus striatus]|nr:hypothetical protein BDQ17DRAFT_1328487 [Cyathus striatus]